MKISKMTICDYDKVYRLWTNSDGMGLRTLDDSKYGIEKFLNRNPNTNFVCRLGDEIIGVILCGHDGRRAYIYHALVSQEHRAKGIGKELLNSVLNSVEKEGINKIALLVFKDNTIGNDFWESQEFIERDDLNYRNRSINIENI